MLDVNEELDPEIDGWIRMLVDLCLPFDVQVKLATLQTDGITQEDIAKFRQIVQLVKFAEGFRSRRDIMNLLVEMKAHQARNGANLTTLLEKSRQAFPNRGSRGTADTLIDKRSPSQRHAMNLMLRKYLESGLPPDEFRFTQVSKSVFKEQEHAGMHTGFTNAEQLRDAFRYDLFHYYDLEAEKVKFKHL